MTSQSGDGDVGHLLRELAPVVLAAVARRGGDFADAEDATQEALIAAAAQWPREGVPRNPRGWLYQVAIRRTMDKARAERARERREQAVIADTWPNGIVDSVMEEQAAIQEDDTVLLLFMCCHPTLTSASAIALTLRAVGGLTTAEIANAFFVPEATMAQRISRAKQSIKTSGAAFGLPRDEERAERLDAVMHVLYLIFNEGYTTSAGTTLNRPDLSNEAIRLTRVLHALLPGDGEVSGLLALMLLTDARRAARTDANGALIPLDEQNRSAWDQALIAEGLALISAALSRGIDRSLSVAGRDSGSHTTRLRIPKTLIGHRFSRCIRCSTACRTTRC